MAAVNVVRFVPPLATASKPVTPVVKESPLALVRLPTNPLRAVTVPLIVRPLATIKLLFIVAVPLTVKPLATTRLPLTVPPSIGKAPTCDAV